MRKYNSSTKKTFIVIVGLFIGILVIFSLFVRLSLKKDKNIYKIENASVIFDYEYNMLSADENDFSFLKCPSSSCVRLIPHFIPFIP